MKPAALIVLALVFARVYAQTTRQANQFDDPANLRGERVKPRDGRELPVDQGERGLEQILRRLSTRASILNIVAHPDDEDGGMLTLYSRGVGARVADLSLTRGEGGQNAMTGDFEDALGLLRTQELLSCDRYAGIDQFFGTEVDFGFSKTKEEAFAKWTYQRVLYDAVRAVRLYRPLVLTSTWIGGVTDGHGQHQVSGEIAQVVFRAAADPTVFPEMAAEGILPWQPLKVYARVPQQAITPQGLFDYATGQYLEPRFMNYVTGVVSTTEPTTDVVLHEGTVDALLSGPGEPPRSYVQFARIGLAQQKSQVGGGSGRLPPAGAFDVSYHRYGSRLPADKQKQKEESFFEGIDTSIEGIAELAPGAFPPGSLSYVSHAVQAARETLDPAHPEAIAPLLASALQKIDATIEAVDGWNGDAIQKANALHELRIKRVQANDALVLALGLSLQARLTPNRPASSETVDSAAHPPALSALPPKAALFPGEGASIVSELSGLSGGTEGVAEVRATVQLNGRSVACAGCSDVIDADTERLEPRMDQGFIAHRDAPVTRPYFRRPNIEQPYYDLLDPALRNAPQTPAPIAVTRELRYRDTPLVTAAVVESNPAPDGDRPDGGRTGQPVSIVPPLSLSLSRHAQVLPSTEKTFSFGSDETPVGANIKSGKMAGIPRSWKSLPVSATANPPGHVDFLIEVPFSARKPATLEFSETLQDGTTYSEGYRPVGYGDLPRTNYYTPATDRIVPVDLKLPAARKVGYVAGTGDAVPEALASIGMKPEMLTVADLTAEKLKAYDSVVLGVRTYAAHPELHGAPTQALLDYARGGGNVVVQYQSAEFTETDAPYPLTLGRDAERVVDETDPVRLLDAHAPLLTTPNKITPADFDGWFEERGHGFLRTWDAHYAALTETHDPGAPKEGVQPEAPQRGGLVTVRLGQGRWTYLAFAVYRQLPEAVPGAFRLFVNLLEKP